VRRESGYLPNPLLLDTLSEMAVPMIIGDRLLGVFDVQSDKLNHFHEEDVRI
jgi:putative methionine-R-sulfoxide reductase with GAF domain